MWLLNITTTLRLGAKKLSRQGRHFFITNETAQFFVVLLLQIKSLVWF